MHLSAEKLNPLSFLCVSGLEMGQREVVSFVETPHEISFSVLMVLQLNAKGAILSKLSMEKAAKN